MGSIIVGALGACQPYQAIVVSQEEGAQVDRLRYILAHGCKEGLVERVAEWPGVHAAPAILSGVPLQGVWHDRTREYLARIQGKEFCPEEYAEAEVLSFSPLPCWAHLSPEQYRARVGRLVEEIEAEAAAQRVQSGRELLGAEAVRRQERTTRPNRLKKAAAPRFHAFTKRVRLELYQAYSWFASAFREAAEKWKAGDRGLCSRRGVSRLGCRLFGKGWFRRPDPGVGAVSTASSPLGKIVSRGRGGRAEHAWPEFPLHKRVELGVSAPGQRRRVPPSPST